MIVETEPDIVFIWCDGCPERFTVGQNAADTLATAAGLGWRDIGAGKTRLGLPFRHLCKTCFEAWEKGDAA